MLERRRISRPRLRRAHAPGFTLPAVIVVSAALLILAVGLLAVIGIERKTARSFADAKRADLAARAGLEDFRAILRKETATEDYLVIGAPSPNVPANSSKEVPQHLFLAKGKGGGQNVQYSYVPLFSTDKLPAHNTKLQAPEIEKVDEDDEDFTPIKALPWQDAPRVRWIPVQDEKGETVARYAYWVEDLQSKVDAKTAGDEDQLVRNEWPFPASGINKESTDKDHLKLDQVAIRVLDPAAVEKDENPLTRKVVDGRPTMLSPESMAASAGYGAPLERDTTTGLLKDKIAAALERSASAVSQPYDERAIVPYAPGISDKVAGKPKLNLNKLLKEGRPAAVEEFAGWINTGLPDFDKNRRGGFPDDYLRTLAANALDYADADNDPTLGPGYRGLDGYPLVSEFASTFRWSNVLRENGRLFVVFTVTTYPELWNMTDQTVSGMAQLSFESDYSFDIGAIAGISFSQYAADSKVATPAATFEDGYNWQPPFQVTLKPNEIKVYTCKIDFKIDVGPSTDFVAGPLTLAAIGPVAADGNTGYHLRWNGKIVDQSRKSIWRANGSVNYPSGQRQLTRAVIPAHSLSTKPANIGPFNNNMGDPRMSFYYQVQQASNAYPENYSGGRRTIRNGTIYASDGATKPKVYGRVLPSEWPDCGHDFPYGTMPSFTRTDQTYPDDPGWFVGVPNPEKERAPMRLSNRGRFYSATELGRTYDPIMWLPTYAKPDGSAITTDNKSMVESGILPGGQASWPDVTVPSSASPLYGGGNTLRVGRAEHPKFKKQGDGLHAAHLLDLFHAGKGTSKSDDEAEGELVDMRGAVNLNTATPDAIRTLAAGMLKQDPRLALTTSKNHSGAPLMASPTSGLELGTPKQTKVADKIADAIVRSRPFACAADIANAHDSQDRPVFGNREMYDQGTNIQWTDSAAEEVFARVYEASTLRSRNFRVWVIGQAVYTPPAGSGRKVEVLSETKKAFTVFADPGERKSDHSIDTNTYRPRVTHENDF